MTPDREASAATSITEGLSEEEAARRRAIHGANLLVAHGGVSAWKAFLETLADPMAIMLAIAAAVYFVLGERRDAIVLLVALVPVLGIDVVLEARSRHALRKLADAVAPRTRVRRGGREVDVATEDLVPGDIVLMREGDILHADGIVRAANNLAIDESLLTGESEAQAKTPDGPGADRFFAGSRIVAGGGLGEVHATGAATRYASIAKLVAETQQPPTPLQQKIRRVVRALGMLAGLVAIATFLIARMHRHTLGESLLGAVSLAMAAIPEEFPLVFTLFLSVGAYRLGRRGALVRRLVSVETLGSATVICTDKTGTLTTGQVALDVIEPLDDPSGTNEVLTDAVLACEERPDDPLERAILSRAEAVDPAIAGRTGYTLVRDYDFDPVGRHMTHAWRRADGTVVVVAKGALEGVLEHCSITAAQRLHAEQRHAALATEALRLLAVAVRVIDGDRKDPSREDDERGLQLVGLLGFRDPLRTEVPAAIAECRAAGIAIKMITGDHAITATAIARRAGLGEGEEQVVTGAQLDGLSPEAFEHAVLRASVFARITPEQKYRIVDALERSGETVAMTGDGINDAPALRRANIGIAMGRRGTEVARAAADLVLLNDDFGAIVGAVREGRRIIANIQRAFLYLIAFHIPIVGLAIAAPSLGLPLILEPIHLVLLELVVHPVSALVFEGEAAPPDSMRTPPRRRDAPLLAGRVLVPSVFRGTLLAATTLAAFIAMLPHGESVARAAALAVLVPGSLVLVWTERTLGVSWREAGFPRGARFWIVTLAVAAAVPVAIYVPALSRALHLAPLSARTWCWALGAALLTVGFIGGVLASVARRLFAARGFTRRAHAG